MPVSVASSILTLDAYTAVTGNLNAVDDVLELESFDYEDIFQDEGHCEFVVPLPYPASLVTESWVVPRLNGTRCRPMKVEQIVEVDMTEPDKRGAKVTCSLMPKMLDNGRVHPSRGYRAQPFSDVRVFSVFSPEFDISGWTATSIALGPSQASSTTYYTGAPSNWQDPTAQLIAPANGTDHSGEIGQWWTQKDFDAVIDMNVVIDCAADNWCEVWLDGQLLGVATGWGSTTSFPVFLKAGTHRIGMKVYNAGDYTSEPPPLNSGGVVTEGNPTMALMAVFPVDWAGRRATAILHTDTTWKIRSFLAAAPGWTIGEVALYLFYENEAEGPLTGVSLGWTATHDTSGVAWPRYEYITLDVMRGLLDVLKEWSTTYCDWTMDVDGGTGLPRLQLYNWTTSPVTDSEATFDHDPDDPLLSSLSNVTTSRKAKLADCLIVRWLGGYFRVPDAGGLKLIGLKLASCRSESEAQAIADKWLAVHGVERVQVAGDVAPNLDNPLSDPPAGNVPYKYFNCGNGVTVDGEYVRVTRIALKLVDGNVECAITTMDFLSYIETLLERAITRLSDGTAQGTAPASPINSLAVAPSPVAHRNASMMSANLSGYIDGVHAKVAVIPDPSEPLMSGIVVKAPSATWGRPLAAGGSANYGRGQFMSFHKWGTGLDDSPNNTLLWRVDPTGGQGMTGSFHLATGLRQDAPYSYASGVTQALWINPTFDTNHVVMTAVAGQTHDFILTTSSVGAVLFRVYGASGAVQSAGDIVARSGAAEQIALGFIGATIPGIQFGNDASTFLTRLTAQRVRATNYLDAAKDVVAWEGTANKQVLIGDVFGVAGIAFGSAIDTIAYRGTVAGQLAVSNGLAVLNIAGSTSNVLLTLKGIAGQTGDHVRGVNSAGATVWAISASGAFTPSAAVPSPLSIAGQITAHNGDAQLVQIGSIFGSAGIGLGSTADTFLIRTGAGASQISDTLSVTNVNHASSAVVAAIGASGQSGLLFVGVTNLGGTVFGVSVGGAVTCLSLNASGGAITGGAITGTTGSFSGNVGVTGTLFSSGISNGNLGIGNTGAISGASTIGASGVITGSSFTATGGSSSLRGVNNNSQGITNCGAITGATTIDASSTVTAHQGINAQFAGITSFVNGLSGNNAWATSSSMSANNYITTSGRALKRDIRDLDPGEYGALLGLRPRRFVFKADDSEHVGLIAEEVAKVLPDAVVTNMHDVAAIEYNHLLVLLIQGFQALQGRVAELEAAAA